MISVALAASACAGWAALAHWIKRSPAFDDPPAGDVLTAEEHPKCDWVKTGVHSRTCPFARYPGSPALEAEWDELEAWWQQWLEGAPS